MTKSPLAARRRRRTRRARRCRRPAGSRPVPRPTPWPSARSNVMPVRPVPSPRRCRCSGRLRAAVYRPGVEQTARRVEHRGPHRRRPAAIRLSWSASVKQLTAAFDAAYTDAVATGANPPSPDEVTTTWPGARRLDHAGHELGHADAHAEHVDAEAPPPVVGLLLPRQAPAARGDAGVEEQQVAAAVGRRTPASARSRTEASSVTSVTTPGHRTERAELGDRARRAPAPRRRRCTTVAPRSSSAAAMALPMPLAPPVTTADRARGSIGGIVGAVGVSPVHSALPLHAVVVEPPAGRRGWRRARCAARDPGAARSASDRPRSAISLQRRQVEVVAARPR